MLTTYCLKVNRFFASGCYSGFSPKAPGTAGSLTFLIFWLLILREQAFLVNLILCIAFIAIGWNNIEIVLKFTKGLVKDKKGKIDPQWVVIDEWAGLYVALLFIDPNNCLAIALAFLLFRIFDASKIPPVNLAEKLPGSLGIMMDDLVAGMMAGVITLVVFSF